MNNFTLNKGSLTLADFTATKGDTFHRSGNEEPLATMQNHLPKGVRAFLRSKNFAVRYNLRTQTFTLTHKTIAGYVLSGMSFSEVIDYAVNHCYPGYDPEPTPTNAFPAVLKMVDLVAAQPTNSIPLFPGVSTMFASHGVRIHNCKYQQVTAPDGSLTVADAPYGIGYGYDKHNDRMSDVTWLEMMKDVPKPCVLILPHEKVWTLVKDTRWGTPDDFVTWIYNGGYRGHQQRMVLWYGCKPDMTRPEVGQPFKDPNSRWTKKALANGRTMARRYYWWHVEQIMSNNVEKTLHPCQIPEEVIRLIIQSTANPGQPIFDPFMGSGTTGVIARRFGYPFVGADVSADYCGIAQKRIMATIPLVPLPVAASTLELQAA